MISFINRIFWLGYKDFRRYPSVIFSDVFLSLRFDVPYMYLIWPKIFKLSKNVRKTNNLRVFLNNAEKKI